MNVKTIEPDILIQKYEECYFKVNSVKWFEVKSFGNKSMHYISNIV